MSGWEKIIGDAILGVTSEDVGIARVVVKTATCHHMFCPRCGSVMDQSRTIVVETMAGDRETPINQVSCGMTRDDGSTCEPSRAFLLKISEGMAERWPDKPRVHFNVNTWEGIERIPAD